MNLPGLILLALLTLLPPTDRDFRLKMNAFVSEGTRQYDRSNRAGIRAMADSLSAALESRSRAGLLNRNDSLEFTADRYKLLGDWHYENSNYDDTSYPKAEQYFLQALDLYRQTGRLFHFTLDKIPLVQRELAQLYYKQERFDAALACLKSAFGAFAGEYNNLFFDGDPLWFDYLDIQAQMALCRARLGDFNKAETILDSLAGCFPKGNERYYETLRKKGKVILLSKAPDREKRALPLYNAYFQWRKEDALATLAGMDPQDRKDYWMRMRPFVTDSYLLEGEDPGLLFDISLFSKGLLLQMSRLERQNVQEEVLSALRAGWKDVQQVLPADGCAIEFIHYEKDGEKKMGAVVLLKKGAPVWIPYTSPIDFLSHEIDGRSNESRLYTTNGKAKIPLYLDKATRQLLWPKKLCQAIGKARRVYFSPDGYLHQVALEYTLPRELEGKQFYRLSSSRELLHPIKVQADSALLVSGVHYKAELACTEIGNDRLAYQYLSQRPYKFAPLTQSIHEADSIHAIRGRSSDRVLKGDEVTESAIRSLLGQFPVISITTHGLFSAATLQQGTDLKPCLEDNTMSECILALAGCERSLGDNRFNPDHLDGLLSAAEIAGLDLSRVTLFAVSACETGLGRISADGVFGLQRGIKNAGAGCLVVSLWDVDDTASSLLMLAFHRNLAQGMPAHEAFWAARETLSKATGTRKWSSYNPGTMTSVIKEEVFSYNLPQYMDAFILIDAL